MGKHVTGNLPEEYDSFELQSPSRTSTEFFASLAYHLAGVAVPDSALYTIKVTATYPGPPQQEYSCMTMVLLTRFIDGHQLDQKNVTGHPAVPAFCQGLCMDIALGNFDVAGEKGQNLLVVGAGSDSRIFRIDNGGSSLNLDKGKLRSADNIYTMFKKEEKL